MSTPHPAVVLNKLGQDRESSVDPESDARPETLLQIARAAWLVSAPDLDTLGETLSRSERARILFWLAPLERLVRAILFLLVPTGLRARQPKPFADRDANAAPARAPALRATPAEPPSGPPVRSLPPRFRYWSTKPRTADLVFDLSCPEAAEQFRHWLDAPRARRAEGPAIPASGLPVAPLARRMLALLSVLEDPGAHVTRLERLLRRRRPAFRFVPPRPPRSSGAHPPGTHALERALNALRADQLAFIGPPLPD